MKKLIKADIPTGYSYAAIDENGLAWAYKAKPFIEERFQWYFDRSEEPYFIGSNFDTANWKNSLISIYDEEETN